MQGALREIRKDSNFLARQQLQEQLQKYVYLNSCFPHFFLFFAFHFLFLAFHFLFLVFHFLFLVFHFLFLVFFVKQTPGTYIQPIGMKIFKNVVVNI